MKLLLAALAAAFRRRRRRPRRTEDAGDMGTAFGLDSITVVDIHGPSPVPQERTLESAWQRRVTRRSRL